MTFVKFQRGITTKLYRQELGFLYSAHHLMMLYRNFICFMEHGKVLTTKLLSQGYQKAKLVATLKKFYGRHQDLVNSYNVAVSRIVSDVFAMTSHK